MPGAPRVSVLRAGPGLLKAGSVAWTAPGIPDHDIEYGHDRAD